MKNILKTYGSVICFYIIVLGGVLLLINKNATYEPVNTSNYEIAYNE